MMALNDRDVSLIKALGEEFSLVLNEMKSKHQEEVESYEKRLSKLESEVEGLISLLGEQ